MTPGLSTSGQWSTRETFPPCMAERSAAGEATWTPQAAGRPGGRDGDLATRFLGARSLGGGRSHGAIGAFADVGVGVRTPTVASTPAPIERDVTAPSARPVRGPQ